MDLMGLRRRIGLDRPEPHEREDRIVRTEAPGAPPGTLTTEPDSPLPVITILAYGPDGLEDPAFTSVDQVPELLARWPVTWLDVDGLGDTELVQRLGQLFGLHQLTLEDVVHVHQRSKVEVFPGYVFAVTRMAYTGHHLETEQLGLLVGERFVVTFQEGYPGDNLDPVRRRLRENIGRLRHQSPGYLAYALIDAVTDHYFPVLATYGDLLDALEDVVLADRQTGDIVSRIHAVKRDLATLKRAIAPQRDAISTLLRDPTPLVDDDTRLHLRDVYDHTVQLIDLLDSYRELSAALIEIHLSLVNNRMNEVMKVLTVVGSVFIPLTFITSLYGMNFDPAASPWNMPELRHHYGYPLILAVMALTALALLAHFARRGWLGSRRRR